MHGFAIKKAIHVQEGFTAIPKMKSTCLLLALGGFFSVTQSLPAANCEHPLNEHDIENALNEGYPPPSPICTADWEGLAARAPTAPKSLASCEYPINWRDIEEAKNNGTPPPNPICPGATAPYTTLSSTSSAAASTTGAIVLKNKCIYYQRNDGEPNDAAHDEEYNPIQDCSKACASEMKQAEDAGQAASAQCKDNGNGIHEGGPRFHVPPKN